MCMFFVHDIRWEVSEPVREFLYAVRAAELPVILVLTKDDKVVDHVKIDKATGLPANPRSEHELRERYMRRIRRELDFSGVHLHYSTNSEKPFSRKVPPTRADHT